MGVEASQVEPTDAQIEESARLSLQLATKTSVEWRDILSTEYQNEPDKTALLSTMALSAMMLLTDTLIALEPDLVTRLEMFQGIVEVGGVYLLTGTNLDKTAVLAAKARAMRADAPGGGGIGSDA